MPKSSQYGKEYNAKRKQYLTQKKKESRQKAKSVLSTTTPKLKVVDKVVDTLAVVDRRVVDIASVVDNPKLTQLINQYQTQTNYSCASSCSLNKYCSNCGYFTADKLIDYKEAIHG